MEYRTTPRLLLEFSVSLNYPSLGLITGKVKNISPNGAFVATQAVKIPRHQLLEMTFKFPGETPAKIHRLGAMVVHVAQDGMGLMFVDAEAQVLNSFTRFRS